MKLPHQVASRSWSDPSQNTPPKKVQLEGDFRRSRSPLLCCLAPISQLFSHPLSGSIRTVPHPSRRLPTSRSSHGTRGDARAWDELHLERHSRAGHRCTTSPAPTLSVEEVANAVGISRTFGYGAVSRGETRCIRNGGRILVPDRGWPRNVCRRALGRSTARIRNLRYPSGLLEVVY
jgi:hypothetical protein